MSLERCSAEIMALEVKVIVDQKLLPISQSGHIPTCDTEDTIEVGPLNVKMSRHL